MAVPSVAGFKAGGGAHHSASSPFLIFIILVVLLFLALLPLDDAVDCDDFESDDDLVVVPCERNGPSWKHLRWQVVLGLGIWACWIAGSELGQRKWEEVCARNPDGAPPPLFRAYVGTAVRLPEKPLLSYALEWAQLGGSAYLVWAWVAKTYTRSPASGGAFSVEVLCVLACLAHRALDHARGGFSVATAASLASALDALTLPAVLLQHSSSSSSSSGGGSSGGSWLTLAYLRSYHQWDAGHRIKRLHLLDAVLSDMTQECLSSLLEFLLVVFSIAGTMWTLEALGDIRGLEDSFAFSGMGGISFFQVMRRRRRRKKKRTSKLFIGFR